MKKLVIATGVFAAALIVVLAILITRLDSLITKAINTYGPDITETDAHLNDVRVRKAGRSVIILQECPAGNLLQQLHHI
jgi:hypothetical protein